MEDKNLSAGTASNDAAGGGQQPDVSGPAGQSGKTFTQQEIDRILAERLNRQKAQFADYDTLKEKAAKWAEWEEKQKSEEQKLQERLAKLEHDNAEAMARSNERLMRAAFIAEAAKAGCVHPEDVFALADRSKVTIDEQGNVLGVTDAVTAIVAAGRVPITATGNQPSKPNAPKLDGGAGGSGRQAEKEVALSDEEIEMARRLGLSAEKYAVRKAELKRNGKATA